jgi:hypothetical protein
MTQKYFTNINKVKDTLDKYGVAIIPFILNNDECEQMINDMWDYLEHITKNWNDPDFNFFNEKVEPIDRNNKDTWKYIYNLCGYSLIFQFWNIGHSQMCWNVRQNKKIVDIFAKIYNISPYDLIASFDGASIQFPPEITNFGWFEDSKQWYHVDHSYNNSDFKNIQSWITAYDVSKDDATLVILESSHKYHKQCGEIFNIKDKKDFKLLNNDEINYYLRNCEKVFIECPKGSLVLWDSRTVHYACEPSNKRKKENIRCISYLCYAPKYLLNSENKLLRLKAYKNLYTTNHDPYNVRFKQPTPYEDIDDESEVINKINKPILNELGLSLVGF